MRVCNSTGKSRTFPRSPWLNNVFCPPKSCRLSKIFIFIFRLWGYPGLPKIKFGGWPIGDKRLPRASPRPPCSPPAPSAAPVAPQGVYQQKAISFKSVANADRAIDWRLRFGLVVEVEDEQAAVDAHADTTRQLSSWHATRWGSSCRQGHAPRPMPKLHYQHAQASKAHSGSSTSTSCSSSSEESTNTHATCTRTNTHVHVYTHACWLG